MHIVLLGDSIFDNGAYTDGGPDVATHLDRLLAGRGRASLLAVDGAVMAELPAQLQRLEALAADAARSGEPVTHLALSIGGNDLLGLLDELLTAPAGTLPGALLQLAAMADPFEARFGETLDAVAEVGLPTVACTVYEGWFQDPVERDVTRTALRIFDDVILQAGRARGWPMVDLRRVCTEARDYWNPIEPSAVGGRKIARAVLDAVGAPGLASGPDRGPSFPA
jgi:hypothetical protein